MLCLVSTQVMGQDVTQSINQHLLQLVESNKLQAQDMQWEITGEHVSRTSNVHHVYFSQTIHGLPIFGTESSIHLQQSGKVISANFSFINSATNRISGNGTPGITAVQAVEMAAGQLGYGISDGITVVESAKGLNQKQLLSDGGISLSDIPAKLVYQLNANNQLVLAWDIAIEETARENWWNVRVDANSGLILDQNNWMVTCAMEHDHSADEVTDYNANLYDIPNYKAEENTAGCNECYDVFALPIESPYFGAITTENSPANLTASPFGWHDTNGVSGPEFTTTRGNNVDAFESGNNPGYRPDGGASLAFISYPFGQVWQSGVNEYEDAAITNLFYWNNIIHDVMYQYGFDEVSGNFQENNYGNGGAGSDSVGANAQITVWCNATFGTPSDGSNPTMNMYICGNANGDGCFDNLVVTHEYGHGISNRLTGGPAASGCLQNTEQMGEGWSDFYGVVLTMEPGDLGTDGRAVGTYLFGQGAGGGGIRPFPYNTDIAANPQTYDDIKTAAVPHGIGSVWATMLWEMTWGLIDEHGWDADIYNFTGDVNLDAGNVQSMALVTEGLKLQPCSPGFVDGRDAILAADLALYGGANECIIWDAFAKRGLGVSADQGSSNSRSDGTEAFDTPSGSAAFTAPADVCANSAVLTGLGGGTPSGGVYSGPGVTDDGNGATYSFDPVAAGIGVHTISYDVAAGACSVASTATDDIEVLAIPPGPATVGVNDFCPGDDVTVTATLGDPLNVIRWYDAAVGGNFLFEGVSYTFTPASTTSVFAQESADVPVSQLVISEFTLQTPDRLEIQNVGEAADYTGYRVAVSADPYPDINAINTITQPLGAMGANAVVDYNDDSGAGYWGNNIFWDESGTGWIIIIDDQGDVVDSVFWNFTAAEIAGLNVTINGFNVTAADLDWSGDGVTLTTACNDSYRRHDDTDGLADWNAGCETSDFGAANSDIGLGIQGCVGDRTETIATLDSIDPVVTCPADVTETVNQGDVFTIPDYTASAVATDNCTTSPVLTQDPIAGTTVGAGVTVITITATDEAGNAVDCTFNLTVEEILGVEDNALSNLIALYPNPTQGNLSLVNNSSVELTNAVITDVNGRIIQTIEINNSGTTTDFSVAQLATGVYFVRINAVNSSVVKRIVRQ